MGSGDSTAYPCGYPVQVRAALTAWESEPVLVSVVAGIVIGLLLGALGGGGAILALPVLVYAAGQSPHDAATGSLVIVGVTSAIAMIPHARAGRVHWRDGLTVGVVGIVGTFVGTELASLVAGQSLLIAFAILLVVVAFLMWRRARSSEVGVSVAPGAAEHGHRPPALFENRAATVIAAATLVGLLTGFFGVGGGFVVVPALVLALGFPMREAVATSLLILALNTTSALTARAVTDGLHLDWQVIGPFTAAAVVGSLIGGRIGARAPATLLQRAFALVLLGAAAYVGFRSLR